MLIVLQKIHISDCLIMKNVVCLFTVWQQWSIGGGRERRRCRERKRGGERKCWHGLHAPASRSVSLPDKRAGQVAGRPPGTAE